jgi:hypothetical protein
MHFIYFESFESKKNPTLPFFSPKYLSKCAIQPCHSLADVLVSFPRVASVASAGAGCQRF